MRSLSAAVLIVLAFVLAVVTQPTLSVNSTNSEFNVTPDSFSLNWTNNFRGILNITNKQSYSTSLAVQNHTTYITPNYSQHLLFSDSRYLWTNTTAGCFNLSNSAQNSPLAVLNGSATLSNTTFNMAGGASTNFTIIQEVACPPGRYYGSLAIYNITNTSESANVTVTIDIPIQAGNELNSSTLTGGFRGTLPSNTGAYHSYYFNTSAIANATWLTMNMSWSSAAKDIELFLFDGSGNLRAKSLNTTNSETLVFGRLPSSEIWEIRVYGIADVENYSSNLLFTTLNATNSTGDIQLSSVDFGTMNVSQAKNLNLTLRNQGNIILGNVIQSLEIYHSETFSSSGKRNFTFIVPAFASRIRASVNWTGGSNYTLKLFSSAGSLVSAANGKSRLANAAKAMQEEYVETTSIAEGAWITEISNNSASADPYSFEVRYYLPASTFVLTDYSAQDFNASGSSNSIRFVNMTFSIPQNVSGGTIKGSIKYADSRGSALELPVSSNITAGMLLANNTLRAMAVNLTANTGFNISGTVLSFSLSLSNNGTAPIGNITPVTSANKLYNSSRFAGFSAEAPSTLGIGELSTLKVNITVNTNETTNTEGLYTGSIFLNSSNTYPYGGFNVTINLNLTTALNVSISQITSAGGDNLAANMSLGENFTLVYRVFYINGSETTALGVSNFSVWLVENNVSKRVPSSGSLTINNISAQPYNGSDYVLNFTVPAGTPGGYYSVSIAANQSAGGTILAGMGSLNQTRVNNTGFNLTANSSTSFSMAEAATRAFNATVNNLGPASALRASLAFNAGNCAATAAATTSTCPADKDSATFTFNMTAHNTTGCGFGWTITASNVSSNTACSDASVTISNWAVYSNITGIAITVTDSGTSSSSSTPSSGGAGAEEGSECTKDSQCADSQQCKDSKCAALSCTEDQFAKNHTCNDYIFAISIEQSPEIVTLVTGGSNETKVTVKNTGERDLKAKLKVETIDGITYEVSPESYDLGPFKTGIFSVKLSEVNARLGDHLSKFIAFREGKPTNSSKDFTLRVAAGEKRKEEIINRTVQAEASLNNLTAEFNRMRAALQPPNATVIEGMLAEAKKSIASIRESITSGDFTNAESMIYALAPKVEEIKAAIAQAAHEQSKAAGQLGSSIWLWAAVAAILAMIAVVVVKFILPARGFDQKRGFTHPEAHFPSKIKGLMKKVKSMKPRKKSEQNYDYKPS